MQANADATAAYVVALTKAVAMAPYAACESALGTVTKVTVTMPSPWPAGSPRDVWWAQLQMLVGLGESKAQAVVESYPTLRALVAAYRDPARSTKDKEKLLQVRHPCSRCRQWRCRWIAVCSANSGCNLR